MNNLGTYIILFFSFLMVTQYLRANSKDIESNLSDSKGILILQFSWIKESLSETSIIEIEYKRKGFFIGSEDLGKRYAAVNKNEFINLELNTGEYKLQAIRIYANSFSSKCIKVPVNWSFYIKNGKITSGGRIYLFKKGEKNNPVTYSKVDNNCDVTDYIKKHNSQYYIHLNNLDSTECLSFDSLKFHSKS